MPMSQAMTQLSLEERNVRRRVVPVELCVNTPDHELDGYVPDDFEHNPELDGFDLPY
jgi:hypothetical protein